MPLPAGVYVHPVGQLSDDAYPETTIGAYLLPGKSAFVSNIIFSLDQMLS
jgi:hypothetical protein